MCICHNTMWRVYSDLGVLIFLALTVQSCSESLLIYLCDYLLTTSKKRPAKDSTFSVTLNFTAQDGRDSEVCSSFDSLWRKVGQQILKKPTNQKFRKYCLYQLFIDRLYGFSNSANMLGWVRIALLFISFSLYIVVNKTGTCQCTWAVWSTFADIHSTHPARCTDELFGVTVISS